ncbi:MAG: retropepsin-like aspartic protease [Porticoccaceae bacterium]
MGLSIAKPRPSHRLTGLICIVLVHTLLPLHAWGAGDATQALPRVIALTEKTTATFYLPALLGNGESAELLFDTGSGYLAINRTLLDKLAAEGQATYKRTINARLASGRVDRVPIYTISRLDLGGGCVLDQVDAAVLAGGGRNILGMNVLRRVESFSMSFSPPRLTLTGCQRA